MPRLLRAVVCLVLLGLVWQGAVPMGTRVEAASTSLAHIKVSGSQVGGRPIELRVILSGPAPAGGAKVTLSASDPVVKVPRSVTVAAGETQRLIEIGTNTLATAKVVTISATYDGVTRTKPTLIRAAVLSGLSVQTVIRHGGTGRVTVKLNGPAPSGGYQVNLGQTPCCMLTLPATVTIPAGKTQVSIAAPASIYGDAAGDRLPDQALLVFADNGTLTFTANTIIRDFGGGVRPTATATEVPTETATSTETATATATSTPTLTATSSPTETATDTSTATSTATATPGDGSSLSLVSNNYESGTNGNRVTFSGIGFYANILAQAFWQTDGAATSGSVSVPTDSSGSIGIFEILLSCSPTVGTVTTIHVTDGFHNPELQVAVICPVNFTATPTQEPTNTATSEPTATATSTSTAALALTINSYDAGTNINWFEVRGTGFGPNTSVTLIFYTGAGTFPESFTTDSAGTFVTSGHGWVCGTYSYGPTIHITAADSMHFAEVDQPFLCPLPATATPTVTATPTETATELPTETAPPIPTATSTSTARLELTKNEHDQLAGINWFDFRATGFTPNTTLTVTFATSVGTFTEYFGTDSQGSLQSQGLGWVCGVYGANDHITVFDATHTASIDQPILC